MTYNPIDSDQMIQLAGNRGFQQFLVGKSTPDPPISTSSSGDAAAKESNIGLWLDPGPTEGDTVQVQGWDQKHTSQDADGYVISIDFVLDSSNDNWGDGEVEIGSLRDPPNFDQGIALDILDGEILVEGTARDIGTLYSGAYRLTAFSNVKDGNTTVQLNGSAEAKETFSKVMTASTAYTYAYNEAGPNGHLEQLYITQVWVRPIWEGFDFD